MNINDIKGVKVISEIVDVLLRNLKINKDQAPTPSKVNPHFDFVALKENNAVGFVAIRTAPEIASNKKFKPNFFKVCTFIEDKELFDENIKLLKSIYKLSYNDIAKATGLSKSRIESYVHDVRSYVYTRNLEKLAKVFGVTVNQLISQKLNDSFASVINESKNTRSIWPSAGYTAIGPGSVRSAKKEKLEPWMHACTFIEDKKLFSSNIQLLKSTYELSYREMSSITCITKATLETYVKKPGNYVGTKNLKKLAKVFGVTVKQLTTKKLTAKNLEPHVDIRVRAVRGE